MPVYEEGMAAFGAAYERALATGKRNMNAMSLATVNKTGQPSARMVLLKRIDDSGLVFFTDERSRKARDLSECALASVCFYWEPIEEQARIDGTVERLDAAHAAADFLARPRAGQIMIWGSAQSQPLASVAALREAVAAQEAKQPAPAPVPPYWAGYKLRPRYIELWRGRRDRMHERVAYTAGGGGWSKQLLQP
ncbi:MAG: pyridoxamine 5'-phosphate oxidase [Gammaproteobacteria bacterium]|nr:pyridoxamine 5'-phosphate oxidase [Gammaproteobacteria bacterium]